MTRKSRLVSTVAAFTALSTTVLLSGCQHVAPAPPPMAALAPGVLHSPWDATPVAPTSAPFDCVAAPPIGPDITVSTTTSDKPRHVSEDVKAAVLAESTGGIEQAVRFTIRAADTYRSTGSQQAAQCAVRYMATAASDQAMTGYKASKDAWMEQNLALRGFAIAYLKVRGSGAASPEANTLIVNWLEALVREQRDHWEHDKCGPNICHIKGHRGLQTAMGAAAVGILANDNGLFHWAVSQYHSAIGEVNGRGMLHYDSEGNDAFLCNLESTASLVQIAEFAEINGQPLYGYDDGRIHLLVHTVALGIVSPEPYHSVSKRRQIVPKAIQPWEIAWASVYNRRFPDPVVTSLLKQVGTSSADMWGGEPWDPISDPDAGAQ